MKSVGFKESRISEELYFEWRKNRARSCIKRVTAHATLNGKTVLDIGCGYGALSSLLLEEGATVYGTEMNRDKINLAKKFLSGKKFTVTPVDDERLPYKDSMFDAIFLFDVIEHVGKPEVMMRECTRVLKPGGLIYVEFTPYYSITGHHLYDFAKWPIHILPREKIKKIVFTKKVDSYMTPQYYWEQFLSLNKLRISDFQRMVKPATKTLEERFIIKYPEVFEVHLPFVNYLGPLKDYLTMSYEGLFRKV